jgi:alpha-tubulin suppressor-like RCC1 family protein
MARCAAGATTTGGSSRSAGAGFNGQLGRGGTSNDDRGIPAKVVGLPTGVIGLAAGESHTCARTETETYCWGNNDQGQLGDGTRGHWTPTPARIELDRHSP